VDTNHLMGLLEPGEDLSTFFRGQRKQSGLLADGILVLTTKRLLWVEEAGAPVAATFADTLGVAQHEHHLSVRFAHAWLSIFCAKPSVAKDAARQIGLAWKQARKAAPARA
jgi:hypothetical protein